MAERSITPDEQRICRRADGRARAAMAAADSFDQAAVDRLCRAIAWAGGNEATRDAARGDECRRERHGQPGAQPAREGAGHPARCPASEEHGRHRGTARERHRQIRQAGRRHRLAHSGDESVRHADRHRDLRDQVQGRGDLLAASLQPPHDERNGAAAARGAGGARRAGRSAAVRRDSQAFRWPRR